MASDHRRWDLIGFHETLERWIADEDPDTDRRTTVANWILGRYADPYAGMRRAEGFDNLWFGGVPGTVRPDGTVIAVSYFVIEMDRTVRCNSITSLNLPI